VTKFILPFLLIALAASAPAAPVAPPPREVKVYFPTTVGTKWVFQWNGGKWKGKEVVEVVTAAEPGTGGAVVVTVGRHEGGRTSPARKYEVSPRGLFWTENFRGQVLDRPWVVLRLPHEPGLKWTNASWDRKTTMTAHGPEKVAVPAGEYDAIRVEERADGHPAPTETRWYATSVGTVMVKWGDYHVGVLKSFSPGGGRAP
jgi:hypothetical protein